MVERREPVITGEEWQPNYYYIAHYKSGESGQRGEQRVEKESGRHVGREREREAARGRD